MISLFAALASILYGAILIWQVLKKSPGDEKMREIQRAIQEKFGVRLEPEVKMVGQ